MAEAATRQFGDYDAERCEDRGQDQCRLVSHAARAVFVRRKTGDTRELHGLTRGDHGACKLDRFVYRHASKVDGHQPGGHLIVRHVTANVGVDKRVNVVGTQLAAVSLFGDDINRAPAFPHVPLLSCRI